MKHFNKIKAVLYFLFTICFALKSYSQNEKKVQFIGTARSIINNSKIDAGYDSITAKRKMNGYALIDLGVNIFPNKNTEILGMVRINNQLGGFYGANVGFDVRQLYLKGIISKAIRYQLGDINYKLTPYTFYNNEHDDLIQQPEVFKLQRDIVNYEVFYKTNTWRQQGAAFDFTLEFAKYIKEIKFNGFINRINVSDFNLTPDRFFTGGNIGIQHSKNVFVGFNYVNLFDLMGSASTKVGNRNNVSSVNYEIKFGNKTNDIRLLGETGLSRSKYLADTLAPELEGFFLNTGVSYSLVPTGIKFCLNYMHVDPGFRSAGAQSKRVNYDLTPSNYNRYTNNQVLRSIGLFDFVRDETIYTTSMNGSGAVMAYNPIYNNVTPYGVATFNRRGLNAKINFTDKKEILKLDLDAYFLNEIIGQGITKLKSFQLIRSTVVFDIKKLAKMENNLKVTAGVSIQSTKRSSEVEYEKIDLKTSMYNGGVEWEFYKHFDFLAGVIANTAKGNELLPTRNRYTEVTDFKSYQVNINEMMMGGGLRYRFSEKIFLTALYQNYNNKNNKDNKASYSINQFLILYNMKF